MSNPKPWYTTWWGVGLISVVTLFAFPFVIGGLLLRLTHRKIHARKVKLALSALILLPTLLFGSAWVSAFVSPSSPPETGLATPQEEEPTPTETPQSTSDEVAAGTEEPDKVLSGEQEKQEGKKEDNAPKVNQSTDSQKKSTTTPSQPKPHRQKVKVIRVIDGDTIEIEGGKKVRYIGIDTPETVHPSKPVECYGKEASAKNKELVGGKIVELEKDVSETDKYGRLLRYVWVDGIFVNKYLVRQGYANASSYPPDVKYQDQFREAEKKARQEGKGLWGDVCQAPKPEPEPEPSGKYTCDCKKTCTEISSCEEAYYQLNTCGCAIRDSDKDGVPCENICPGG